MWMFVKVVGKSIKTYFMRYTCTQALHIKSYQSVSQLNFKLFDGAGI